MWINLIFWGLILGKYKWIPRITRSAVHEILMRLNTGTGPQRSSFLKILLKSRNELSNKSNHAWIMKNGRFKQEPWDSSKRGVSWCCWVRLCRCPLTSAEHSPSTWGHGKIGSSPVGLSPMRAAIWSLTPALLTLQSSYLVLSFLRHTMIRKLTPLVYGTF